MKSWNSREVMKTNDVQIAIFVQNSEVVSRRFSVKKIFLKDLAKFTGKNVY